MTLDGVLAVSNVGAAPAAASVASIGISPDGAMHPGDTALRTVPVAALKPGQERRVQVRVALPKGTSVSGKFVIAAANAGSTVTAVNPANDVAVRGPMK